MHLIKVYVGFLSLSTVLALPLAAQRSSTSALSAREEKVALMARAAPLYEDTPHPRELQRDGSGKAVESFQKPQLPSEEGSSPNGNGASRRIKGSIYDDSEMPDITQRGSWDIEARAKKYSKPVPGGKDPISDLIDQRAREQNGKQSRTKVAEGVLRDIEKKKAGRGENDGGSFEPEDERRGWALPEAEAQFTDRVRDNMGQFLPAAAGTTALTGLAAWLSRIRALSPLLN